MSKDQSKVQQEFKYFVFGLGLSAVAYVLGSWAIDSGSLLVYGLTFVAVYFAIKFLVIFIRVTFFKNDKSESPRRAKAKTTKG